MQNVLKFVIKTVEVLANFERFPIHLIDLNILCSYCDYFYSQLQTVNCM